MIDNWTTVLQSKAGDHGSNCRIVESVSCWTNVRSYCIHSLVIQILQLFFGSLFFAKGKSLQILWRFYYEFLSGNNFTKPALTALAAIKKAKEEVPISMAEVMRQPLWGSEHIFSRIQFLWIKDAILKNITKNKERQGKRQDKEKILRELLSLLALLLNEPVPGSYRAPLSPLKPHHGA